MLNIKIKIYKSILIIFCFIFQLSIMQNSHAISPIFDFEDEKTENIQSFQKPKNEYNPMDNKISNSQISNKKSIKNLLEIAIQPVGKTMYVWGGGWNKEDTGSGIETVSLGLSKRWLEFSEKQNKNYNYKKTRFQIHDGLDCSGYIGWVIYNLFNTENGKQGYVMLADKMAKSFSDKGFGDFTPANSVKSSKPGDIMSNKTHVYISLGTCKDGSVVLVHSSPPGVQINGTVNLKGQKNSDAKKLADKYMKKYYPKWHSKYGTKVLDKSYLKSYNKMTWNRNILTDEERISNMNANEVLKILFNE